LRLFARGREADGDIALAAQRLDLAGEDLLITHVVRGRRQHRCVRRQRECGDGLSVVDEAHGEFGRDVLAVGGAAAIAEEHQLAAAPDRSGAGIGQRFERGFQQARRLARHLDVFVENEAEFMRAH